MTHRYDALAARTSVPIGHSASHQREESLDHVLQCETACGSRLYGSCCRGAGRRRNPGERGRCDAHPADSSVQREQALRDGRGAAFVPGSSRRPAGGRRPRSHRHHGEPSRQRAVPGLAGSRSLEEHHGHPRLCQPRIRGSRHTSGKRARRRAELRVAGADGGRGRRLGLVNTLLRHHRQQQAGELPPPSPRRTTNPRHGTKAASRSSSLSVRTAPTISRASSSPGSRLCRSSVRVSVTTAFRSPSTRTPIQSTSSAPTRWVARPHSVWCRRPAQV